MDTLAVALALLMAIFGIVMTAVALKVNNHARQKETEIVQRQAKLEAAQKALEVESAKSDELAEKRKLEIVLQAKDEAHRLRQDAENEIRDKRADAQRVERRAIQKEEALERRLEVVDKRERQLDEEAKAVQARLAEADALYAKQHEKLQEVARLSVEEARAIFLERVEADARQDAARLIRRIEEEAKREGDRRARATLADIIQRSTAEVVNETTVSVVDLPTDDMKGRIIGREGRNIRTFEQILGVDLIIDDTPEAVVISCFDPIRREIARIALVNLVVDGRIHPTRIEEMAEKARLEVERQIVEAGEQAALRAGLASLHPEIVRQMGRLKFRTSYGQNVLDHSVEVAMLATAIASEIGANAEVTRRAAFLHDIGKSMDIEIEGPHALIGMEFLKKHGESNAVANAVGAHHHDIEPDSLEAILVIASDSLSAARPGARRETLESYIKRLEKLEEIAESFEGVEKSYAIQAGREVRIIVRPGDLDEYGAQQLARSVAKRIEEEMEYPGQIKVTVIRETRISEYAR